MKVTARTRAALKRRRAEREVRKIPGMAYMLDEIHALRADVTWLRSRIESREQEKKACDTGRYFYDQYSQRTPQRHWP